MYESATIGDSTHIWIQEKQLIFGDGQGRRRHLGRGASGGRGRQPVLVETRSDGNQGQVAAVVGMGADGGRGRGRLSVLGDEANGGWGRMSGARGTVENFDDLYSVLGLKKLRLEVPYM